MKPDDFQISFLTVIFFILLAAMPVLAQPTGGPPAGTLPQLASGQSLGIALGIPTVPNLRDVGGYKTRDVAIVAIELAYRSDTFNLRRQARVPGSVVRRDAETVRIDRTLFFGGAGDRCSWAEGPA